MPDDVVRQRVALIERALRRVREDFRNDSARLYNQSVQDAMVLNLVRATEAASGLALHLVARDGLGLPRDAREAFALLHAAGRLDDGLAGALRQMAEFRDAVLRQERPLDRAALLEILRGRLGSFEELCRAVLSAQPAGPGPAPG